MSDTVFVNGVTLSDDDWFNDVNRLHYTIFADPATAAAARGTLVKAYTSTDQTITAAGALTLAHGLGATPTLLSMRIKCTSADLGYSINDEVFVSALDMETNAHGASVVPDATNLNIRFADSASTFLLPNKTTGAIGGIDDSKWKVIFRAWVL